MEYPTTIQRGTIGRQPLHETGHSDVPRDRGEIAQRFDEINMSLESLRGTRNALLGRLDPVLSPGLPESTRESGRPPSSCALSESLAQIRDEIDAVTLSLQAGLQALQL